MRPADKAAHTYNTHIQHADDPHTPTTTPTTYNNEQATRTNRRQIRDHAQVLADKPAWIAVSQYITILTQYCSARALARDFRTHVQYSQYRCIIIISSSGSSGGGGGVFIRLLLLSELFLSSSLVVAEAVAVVVFLL